MLIVWLLLLLLFRGGRGQSVQWKISQCPQIQLEPLQFGILFTIGNIWLIISTQIKHDILHRNCICFMGYYMYFKKKTLCYFFPNRQVYVLEHDQLTVGGRFWSSRVRSICAFPPQRLLHAVLVLYEELAECGFKGMKRKKLWIDF